MDGPSLAALTAAIGAKSYVDVAVHHLQSPHDSLAGRRLRVSVTFPDLTPDAVSGDFFVPEADDLREALTAICPVTSAEKGLVLTSCRGTLAVETRVANPQVLETALNFSSAALSRAIASDGLIDEVRVKVALMHVGHGGLSETIGSGTAIVSLQRLLLYDKVVGVRVATAVGQVGILLSTSENDLEGFRRRLEAYLTQHSGQTPAAVEARVKQVLSMERVNEGFVFAQLRERFEKVSIQDRLQRFAALYRIAPSTLTDAVSKWVRHESRLLAVLTMSVGPESGDVDFMIRVAQFALSQDIDLPDALRWLVTEDHPEVASLSDDQLEEKADSFFVTPEQRDRAMARLVEKHGPEAPPTTYLFRQARGGLAPKLELARDKSAASLRLNASPSASQLSSFRSQPVVRAGSITTHSNASMSPAASVVDAHASRTPPRSSTADAASAPAPPEVEDAAATTMGDPRPQQQPQQQHLPALPASASPALEASDGDSTSPGRQSPAALGGGGGLQRARTRGTLQRQQVASPVDSPGQVAASEFPIAPSSANPPPPQPSTATTATSMTPTSAIPRSTQSSFRKQVVTNDGGVQTDAARPQTPEQPAPVAAHALSSSWSARDGHSQDAADRRRNAAATRRDRTRAQNDAGAEWELDAPMPKGSQQHATVAMPSSVRSVATKDSAVQVDTGKAAPVIVAVPSGLSSTTRAATQAASSAAAVWHALEAFASADDQGGISDTTLLFGSDDALRRVLDHDRVYSSLAAALGVSGSGGGGGAPRRSDIVSRALDAALRHRRTLLQFSTHLRTVTPATDPAAMDIVNGFQSAASPLAQQQGSTFSCNVAMIVSNALLDSCFDRHVALQRAHSSSTSATRSAARPGGAEAGSVDVLSADAAGNGGMDSGVRRCFAWCSDVAAAMDAASNGVQATPTCPFLFRQPSDVRRAALRGAASSSASDDAAAAGVDTIGSAASPAIFGQSRVGGAGGVPRAGAVLVCDVYTGHTFRTVMAAVPADIPLRADLDEPFSWRPSMMNAAAASGDKKPPHDGGTGEWEGRSGLVYDTAIVKYGAPGEALAVFSPVQICVRAILIGVWEDDRTNAPLSPNRHRAVDVSAGAGREAHDAPTPAPAAAFNPRDPGGALLLPSRTFAAAASAARQNANTPAEGTPHSIKIAGGARPGTWSHHGEVATVSAANPSARSDDVDPAAAAVRAETTRGWRLFRSGDVEAAGRAWASVAMLGAEGTPTHGADDAATELTDAERCARMEALGILHEVVEKDARGAELAYRRALDHDPRCAAVLFRLGSVLETAHHEHGAALALFDQAAALGDTAAQRRAVLLRRRLQVMGS